MASLDKEPGIKKIYKPTDQEQDVLNLIYKRRYPKMRENPERTEALRRAKIGEDRWESYRKEKSSEDWQSNHMVPLVFSTIETAMAEFVTQQIRPNIRGRNKEDEPRAILMKPTFSWSWEIARGDLMLHDIVQDGLMRGTSIAQEYYWKDRREIQDFALGPDKKTLMTTVKEAYAYDDVYTENVPLEDFFPDEKAKEMMGPCSPRDAIRRYAMPKDDFDLFFKGPIWDPLNNAQYVKPGCAGDFYENYRPLYNIDHTNDVEVLWYWAQRPKDMLVIVANDVVIKAGPNPYRHKRIPFARFVDVKRTKNFWGKGEGEILDSTEDEMTTLRRMIIDRNHLDLDKMFLVSTRLQLNDEDLIARPHGAIPSDEANAVKPVEYGDVPRSVELSLSHLQDDAVTSSGINPRAQALPSRISATQAAIIKETMLRRVNKKIWLMKTDFLTDLAELRVSNIIQFYAQPRLEKIVGKENIQKYQQKITDLTAQGLLVQQDGEDFQKNYRQIGVRGQSLAYDEKGKLTATPSSTMTFFDVKPEDLIPTHPLGFYIEFDMSPAVEVSKPLQQDKDAQLYDRLIQNPGFDPVKLGEMLLESNDKNPEDFKPVSSVNQEQEQMIATMINLASQENKMMIQGKEVPPTQYASPAHTRVHAEYMQSPDFQNAPMPVVKIFVDHVVGETAAQEIRGMGGALPSGAGGPPGVPGGAPGGAPGGPPVQGGISQGITNRPGGMMKPNTKMQNVMPAFQGGANRNVAA